MKWLKPESSNIKAMAYDIVGQRLGIQFKNARGVYYEYQGVPIEVWLKLTVCMSTGQMFDKLVKKGGYPYEKKELPQD